MNLIEYSAKQRAGQAFSIDPMLWCIQVWFWVMAVTAFGGQGNIDGGLAGLRGLRFNGLGFLGGHFSLLIEAFGRVCFQFLELLCAGQILRLPDFLEHAAMADCNVQLLFGYG